MAQTWKTVRVFISSTFRDMHAERDHLVRFVFPELKERCRQLRVRMIDVDLRWGVTEEDAQTGKALDICLDEIDTCRPYFIGLLGHRYGYIPAGHRHSITAQEIYHGVLHSDLPNQVSDLRKIIEGKLESQSLSNEERNCLNRCYVWDADKGKYLLREDVSIDEEYILRSVFQRYSIYQQDRSYFFFRSEALTRRLAADHPEDFFEDDPDAQQNVLQLKTEIRGAGLPVHEYDNLETFGQLVRDTLWARIQAEAARPVAEKDWLEQEAEFHELFMADRTRRFVGRRVALDRMHAFCERDDEPSLLVITGEPGCGKSALMARFTEEAIQRHPAWLMIPHFVGASPASTNLRRMLRRFCTQLNRAIGSAEEVPEDIKELLKLFPELLAKAATNRKVLVMIDAVNQLEKSDNAHSMSWLPLQLPQNVRFVTSTLASEVQDALLARLKKPQVEQLRGLSSDEIRELVKAYLAEIRHEFPNPQVEAEFFAKVGRGNPLYILVALEELRVFGKFEELKDKIKNLPDNVPDLFDQVLERIEGDFNRPLVRDCTAYIACGRQGMTAEELQTLLKQHAPRLDPSVEPVKLPDLLWSRLYRSFSSYLFERSGVIDFFHGQLKEAVGKRYLSEDVDRVSAHNTIADYFEMRWNQPYIRALDELPHQRIKGRDWEGLQSTLCDLQFIQAKVTAEFINHLIQDYSAALLGWPDRHPDDPFREVKTEGPQHLRKDDVAEEVLSEMNTAEKRAGSRRQFGQALSPEKLEAFQTFVASNAPVLAAWPEATVYRAFNYANEGPVVHTAWQQLSSETLLETPAQRLTQPPSFQRETPLLRSLEGHRAAVVSVYASHNGRVVISVDDGGTIRVWDSTTGESLQVIERKRNISSTCWGASEQRMVLGYRDGEVELWDTKNWQSLGTLDPKEKRLCSFCLLSDDQLLSGDSSGAICLWNVEENSLVDEIGKDSGAIRLLAVTENGSLVLSLSVGEEAKLKLWDVESRSCLGELDGHAGRIRCVWLSRDGRIAVSGSDDWTIRIWELTQRECIKILEGHSSGIASVSCTPGARFILSSGMWDRNLLLWDAINKECLRTFVVENDFITCCSLAAASGRIAAAGYRSGVVRVWDLAIGGH